MKNNKLCLSKQATFVFILGIILGAGLLFTSSVSNNKTALNTRATGPVQHDCGVGISGGVVGRFYFIKDGKWYRDSKWKYQIPALGVYCTENLETSTRCRDVRMDYGDCKKPLFKIGNIEKFYTNSSCQGVIYPLTAAIPLSSETIRENYCDGSKPYYLAYACSAPNEQYSVFLPPNSGEYTQNFGNYCKLMAGELIPGFERYGTSCKYFNFGTRTDRIIFMDLKSKANHPVYFYDSYGIYTEFPGGGGNVADYCYDDNVNTLDEYLVKYPAKVDCTKYVSGGLSKSILRYAGNNIYYSGGYGNQRLKLLTPQDVCRGTIRTSTCYNYAKLFGTISRETKKQFRTSDEIEFSDLNNNKIDSILGYCAFEPIRQKDGTIKGFEFNSNY